jgi:hypothetical protein
MSAKFPSETDPLGNLGGEASGEGYGGEGYGGEDTSGGGYSGSEGNGPVVAPDLPGKPLTKDSGEFREGDKDKNGPLNDGGVALVRWVVPALLLLGVLGLIGGGLILLPKLNAFTGLQASSGPSAPTATQATPAATATNIPIPTNTPAALPTNTLPPQPTKTQPPKPTNTPVPQPPHLSVTPSQASAFCLNNSYPSITVKNTGGQTLNWTASGPSSPPVMPSPVSGSLAPGATQTVTVSGSHPGPTVTIQFTGNGGNAAVTYTCQ